MRQLNYRKIGTRIRQARKEKGWSQEKLAKKCGVSLNFIGQIERGTRRMSLDTFANLCRELEMDAGMMLSGVPQRLETEMQHVWGLPRQEDQDSYEMYIRIMKSVADIMKSGDGIP